MPHAVIFKPVTRQLGFIKLSFGSANCIVLVIIVCLNWKQMQRESFLKLTLMSQEMIASVYGKPLFCRKVCGTEYFSLFSVSRSVLALYTVNGGESRIRKIPLRR